MFKKLLLATLLFGLSTQAYSKDKLKVGDIPPDYLGETLEGQEIRLSDHEGKVRIINFWATWCAPCWEELPVLNGLQELVPESQLKIISVNHDQTRRQVRKMRDKMGEDVALTLTWSRKNKAARSYGVRVLPRMFMIGRDGKIAYMHTGYGKRMIPKLVEEVYSLLEQQ
ncbi:MAG: TlpA family protein disulfide reductase [Kordiimonas sp.]